MIYTVCFEQRIASGLRRLMRRRTMFLTIIGISFFVPDRARLIRQNSLIVVFRSLHDSHPAEGHSEDGRKILCQPFLDSAISG